MTLDLQVNGYLNVDFSSDSMTEEDLCYIIRKYLENGADRFLPTVITSPMELYKKNLNLMARVLKAFGDKVPGIHLEGPFISGKPGAVGAHNPLWASEPNPQSFKQMQEWACGHIKIITVAAELPGAEKFCREVTASGVTVSLGHQLASIDDLKRLRDAGASALTHLGNGMPNNVDRHDNPLLNGLAVDGLKAMVIADGHHLPENVLKLIIAAKGIDNVIVTSDASPLAGMPPGKYETLGNSVVLEEAGKLHNPVKQCLVGSSSTLNDCVKYLKKSGFSSDEIDKMCSENPQKLICV